MKLYCQHALCRAHTAEELAHMGRRLIRADILKLAAEALRATVRCRREPRKGPIHVPFAVRKSR